MPCSTWPPGPTIRQCGQLQAVREQGRVDPLDLDPGVVERRAAGQIGVAHRGDRVHVGPVAGVPRKRHERGVYEKPVGRRYQDQRVFTRIGLVVRLR
jgi:hypothetical protein